MRLSFLIPIMAIVMTGCSTQTIRPAENHALSGTVCVTPDPSNRKIAYLSALDALIQKGYKVKEVSYSESGDCDIAMHCQTISRWDLANFTSKIDLEWVENKIVIGEAHYNHRGGLAFSKFINTKEKMNDLLNKMLPHSRQLQSRYATQPLNW